MKNDNCTALEDKASFCTQHRWCNKKRIRQIWTQDLESIEFVHFDSDAVLNLPCS